MKMIETEHKRKQLYQYIDDNTFSILSSSFDVFLIIDVDGQITYVSKSCEVLLGYSTDAILTEMNLVYLFGKTNYELFLKGKACEQLNQFYTKINLAYGKYINVDVVTIPIFSKSESIYIGSYIVFKEAIQHKDKQYRNLINTLTLLSEKYATAGQLAAGIAHEIRNPITAIKGFLQLLYGENIGNQAYYEIINSEIERIEVILKELMVLAKPTKQSFVKANFRQILDQVLILMEPQAILNNIKIIKGYSFTNLWIMGDESQLKQVFINFIKNAVEAMPNGGEIRVNGTIVEDNLVCIDIVDHGCGIPVESLHRIGEPFFTTKENGTGLGMLVSHHIIEEHKGDITIKSNENGTSITVQLPLFLYGMEK
ncbi:PAS domain-containing protein [Bacillus sp. BGMRC 2118]|nr:PAS domain-containing protein [Bacillus sp. BGMRC 2118]